MKYIFVTGGVLSGVGKGITAASFGTILKARGLRVYMQKFDQYLNVDAGMLNPGEHGEVFITEDGAQTDLDLGHYERFIDINLSSASSVMTGNIYSAILRGEREGKYQGKTVQVIPHVTDEVKSRLKNAGSFAGADVLITEIGGTVGDYEGMHFLEAIRQMATDVGSNNVFYIHVGFLPYLGVTEELKTKPIQNSIRDLQAIGIKPDLVICRSDKPVAKSLLSKISLFSGVGEKAVIALETVDSVYKVPLMLENSGCADVLLSKLGLKNKKPNLKDWQNFVSTIDSCNKPCVKIGIVGEYITMKDAYLSVTESIKIAAWHNGLEAEIAWIDPQSLEDKKKISQTLFDLSGIVVPGSSEGRAYFGKINAIEYARKNNIPFLGLCFGMQAAVVEFARNVCGLKYAGNTLVNKNAKDKVVDFVPSKDGAENKSGTLRLGAYPCNLSPASRVAKLYKKTKISERHHHSCEINPHYYNTLKENGLFLAGFSPDKRLVEFIEIKEHKFFIATIAHPEFKSRPNKPHPLFNGFIRAAST